MKFLGFLIFASFFGGTASAVVAAVDLTDEKATTISAIETREISDAGFQAVWGKDQVLSSNCNVDAIGTFKDKNPNPLDPLDQLDMIIDKIINIGTKIWKVIEMGRPVVNVKNDVGTALPAGARCWLDLEGWSVPASHAYEVRFKNGYNAEVVKFSYRVLYVSGGSVNGAGKFIGYATFLPIETSVAWGFKFNAEGSVPAVFNTGTKSNPVAGMQLIMNYKVDTVMKHIQQAQSYYLDGNGKFVVQ